MVTILPLVWRAIDAQYECGTIRFFGPVASKLHEWMDSPHFQGNDVSFIKYKQSLLPSIFDVVPYSPMKYCVNPRLLLRYTSTHPLRSTCDMYMDGLFILG